MESSIEKRLHEFALVSIKEDSLNMLKYLLDINSEYYKDNKEAIEELYMQAIYSSASSVDFLFKIFFNNNSKTLHLK